MTILLLTAFGTAALTAFLLTPWVKRLAQAADAIDKPDRCRKLHRRLVSLWGGLAVFPGLVLGVAAGLAVRPAGQALLAWPASAVGRKLGFMATAGLLLLAMGLRDDRAPLPPKVKLLVQLAAAGLMAGAGFGFLEIRWPGAETTYALWPGLGLALGGLWLVFATNAYNFVDGLDGLASGKAVIAGLGLAAVGLLACRETLPLAARHQCQLASLIAAAVAGAGLGFWKFNRFPAKIFLGEAGSALLGFFLGLAGLMIAGRATRSFAPLAVLVILAWPIADAGLAILRRWRRREPVSKADHRHLHHRLVDMGFSPSAAVAFIHAVSLALAAAGVVLAWV